MTRRPLGLRLRRTLLRGLGRLLSPRAAAPLPTPVPLEDVGRAERSPLALSRLLIGRDNAARQAAVAWYLERLGAPVARHRFSTLEGTGETFAVDLGSGDRVLALCAHHDAVPGSPGANDNAAAVGILLHLLLRGERLVPPGWRVRFLFTACEELDYLGARAYVAEQPLDAMAGVLSLELCGIGDALALWDVERDGPFLAGVTAALEGAGLRRDQGFHVVGRLPVFGSDHRAFAAAGIPAYGLSIVPLAHADALRQLVFNPWRSTLRALVRRPPPFDTYHTPRDGLETLEPAALERVARALEAVIAGLGQRAGT
ncbi:MAG TPA: M28 family peptidase [Methylomirabilota bacterium]|nr:M28 family peptidase [Methylomirabilota bacterium]